MLHPSLGSNSDGIFRLESFRRRRPNSHASIPYRVRQKEVSVLQSSPGKANAMHQFLKSRIRPD